MEFSRACRHCRSSIRHFFLTDPDHGMESLSMDPDLTALLQLWTADFESWWKFFKLLPLKTLYRYKPIAVLMEQFSGKQLKKLFSTNSVEKCWIFLTPVSWAPCSLVHVSAGRHDHLYICFVFCGSGDITPVPRVRWRKTRRSYLIGNLSAGSVSQTCYYLKGESCYAL